jgi:hypothetical protein
MKYIIKENQLRNVQFKYLDYLFEDIYEVRRDEIPNTIYWKKGDEIMFSLSIRRGNKLDVAYTIWNDISEMFLLEYNETQDLMEEWVEQHLGFGKISAGQVDYF